MHAYLYAGADGRGSTERDVCISIARGLDRKRSEKGDISRNRSRPESRKDGERCDKTSGDNLYAAGGIVIQQCR